MNSRLKMSVIDIQPLDLDKYYKFNYMIMKEKILEAFSELGFNLENEEFGYTFHYEGINMLLMINDDDENFLNIAVPGIVDFTEDNTAILCALMEKVNSTLKYVKAYVLGESVWLFYERELFSEDDLSQLISRMILHLETALYHARKVMQELSEEKDENHQPILPNKEPNDEQLDCESESASDEKKINRRQYYD